MYSSAVLDGSSKRLGNPPLHPELSRCEDLQGVNRIAFLEDEADLPVSFAECDEAAVLKRYRVVDEEARAVDVRAVT